MKNFEFRYQNSEVQQKMVPGGTIFCSSGGPVRKPNGVSGPQERALNRTVRPLDFTRGRTLGDVEWVRPLEFTRGRTLGDVEWVRPLEFTRGRTLSEVEWVRLAHASLGLAHGFVPIWGTIGTQLEAQSYPRHIKLKRSQTSRDRFSFVAGAGLEPATFGL